MAIRVEYGPSAASVGRLAYETGIGQYQNKRRTELEALAMQQAEMRQKAQMQQQQLLASLRGQQMSHMSAMQRLQVGQQFGQINAEQAHQRNLQLSEDSREHSLNLAEVHNEDTIERTKLRMGMENQQQWEHASFKLEMTTGYDNLNAAGKQAKTQGLQDLARMYTDPRIKEEDRQGYIDKKKDELRQIDGNPLYHIGKHQEIGFTRKVGLMPDGNHMYIEERVGQKGTADDWRKTPNLVRVNAKGVKSQITTPQWLEGTKHYYEVNGRPWLSRADVNGNWIDEPVDTSKEDAARLDRQEKAIEWEIKERDKLNEYNNDVLSRVIPGVAKTPEQWRAESGPNPYGDARPQPRMQRGGQTGQAAPSGRWNDPMAIWNGAAQPTRIDAPPAYEPRVGGVHHREVPLAQQAPAAPQAPATPQLIAPPDLNIPAGGEGAEVIALSEEEAAQMVRAGHIPAGTIVQLPSGKKIPAGQQADPLDIPLMIRAAQ